MPRRTQAQIAADHQRKANVARAKAEKQKQARRVKALLTIGQALVDGAATGKLTVDMGNNQTKGGLYYIIWRLKGLLSEDDKDLITEWWVETDYPAE